MLKGKTTTLQLLASHSSDVARLLLRAVTVEEDHSGTEKYVLLHAGSV